VGKHVRNPVSKTLRALSWLVESSPPQVGVRQIAAAMNIAPSSAHRILLALSEAGYVRQDRATQRYTLGNEFFRLSQIAVAKAPLRQAALAAMQRLVDSFKESTLLCVYDEWRQEVTFAAAVDSARSTGRLIEMNKWRPVRTSASGMAILACLKEDEVRTIARRANFLRHANTDLAEPGRLRSELAGVRHKGYASAPCQSTAGGVCLAAPIFGTRNKVLGTICVTIPQERAEKDGMDQLINAMLYCANDITKKMYGSVRSLKAG